MFLFSKSEKQRPMLDRDDVYHKREKKGKTLREMFFGTKSGHKNKTSMEAVEEEHDINKSRDGTKTDEELNESMGERKGRKGKIRISFCSLFLRCSILMVRIHLSVILESLWRS